MDKLIERFGALGIGEKVIIIAAAALAVGGFLVFREEGAAGPSGPLSGPPPDPPPGPLSGPPSGPPPGPE